MAFDSYINRAFGAESANDPNAQNPFSSASGLGQFTTGTWQDMMDRYPDLGLTADGRTSPDQSRKAMQQFTADNASVLNSNGYAPTDNNLYALHRFGTSGGTKLLGSDPNAPISSVVSSDVMDANPDLADKTVGQVLNRWSDGQAGARLGGAPVDIGSRDPNLVPANSNGVFGPNAVMTGGPPSPSALPANSMPTSGNAGQLPAGGDDNASISRLLAQAGASKFAKLTNNVGDIGIGLMALSNPQAASVMSGQLKDTRQQNITYDTQQATFRALSARGVPAAEAAAASLNPDIMKAVSAKYFETKPVQVVKTGVDFLGQESYSVLDPAKGTLVPLSQYQAQHGGAAPGAPGSTAPVGSIPMGPDGSPIKGQELLAHLEKTNPVAAAGVKGIIAGDINAGGRNLQKLVPLAELVDPTLKQFDYNTRMKTRTGFTSGRQAEEIKSINTAIGHAAQLSDISPKLGGSNVAPGIVNPVLNLAKRTAGDTAFQDAKTDWDAKAETLATEVSKALNGGKPHVSDKEHWRGILQAANSPAERTSALKSVMGILESRLESNANEYNQGMGTTREGYSFLMPQNVERYKNLLATGTATAASAAQPTNRPPLASFAR